jgi:hypothetical protein
LERGGSSAVGRVRAVVISMNTLDAGAIPGRSIEVCIGHVAMGQFFLWVLWFSPVSIIPPMLHTMLLPETQTGEAWEPSSKQCSFGNRGS